MSSDEKQRRVWDRQARDYDRQMSFLERRFLRDTRAWVGGQASRCWVTGSARRCLC
ncbi:hypothetical protein [Micromonospora sp. AP08]|uniref:hypothetical protein n=1 Tax=Micromonospora sp. AP08 TaxID=2604467 RepID=UPI0016525598|nr:hypothetical protein [Micromonospora sp. AP08]